MPAIESSGLLVLACGLFVPLLFLVRLHPPLLIEGPKVAPTRLVLTSLATTAVGLTVGRRFDRASLWAAVSLVSVLVHRSLFRAVWPWFERELARRSGPDPYGMVRKACFGLFFTVSILITAVLVVVADWTSGHMWR